jgi:hypothetical protein
MPKAMEAIDAKTNIAKLRKSAIGPVPGLQPFAIDPTGRVSPAGQSPIRLLAIVAEKQPR